MDLSQNCSLHGGMSEVCENAPVSMKYLHIFLYNYPTTSTRAEEHCDLCEHYIVHVSLSLCEVAERKFFTTHFIFNICLERSKSKTKPKAKSLKVA